MSTRSRLKYTISFACCLLMLSAHAQIMTLQEAVLLALRYNPNVRNAYMQRVLDKYNLRIAEYEFQWQYNLTGQATHSRNTSSGSRTVNNSYSLSPTAQLKSGFGTTIKTSFPNSSDQSGYKPKLDIEISQPLIRGFGSDVVERGLRDAYDDEYIAKLQLKQALIEQISSTIDAYWSFVQAKISLRTQLSSLRSARKLVVENKAMIRAGRMAPNDNISAISAVASQRLSVTQARFSIESARQSLLRTIGFIDPNKRIDVISHPHMGSMKIPTLKKSLETAMKFNINYRRALITVKKDRRSLLVARDNARVKLDASLNTSFGPGAGLGGITDGQNRMISAALNLTVPIKDLNLERAVVAAKIQLDQDIVNLKEQKRDLEIQIRQSINNLKSQRQQIHDAGRAVRLAADSLRLERKKLKFGLSTSINVTTQRTLLTNNEISLINSKIAFHKAMTDFNKLLGVTLDVWGIQVKY